MTTLNSSAWQPVFNVRMGSPPIPKPAPAPKPPKEPPSVAPRARAVAEVVSKPPKPPKIKGPRSIYHDSYASADDARAAKQASASAMGPTDVDAKAAETARKNALISTLSRHGWNAVGGWVPLVNQGGRKSRKKAPLEPTRTPTDPTPEQANLAAAQDVEQQQAMGGGKGKGKGKKQAGPDQVQQVRSAVQQDVKRLTGKDHKSPPVQRKK